MLGEIQEGTAWHVFLVTSLTCVKEVTSKTGTARRAAVRASVEVVVQQLDTKHKTKRATITAARFVFVPIL
jgi:hypothetical protein